MKTTQLIIAACLLLLITPFVYAQQAKGDFQLQAQFSYTNSTFTFNGNSSNVSNGLVFISASRFFTDKLEAGVSPIISIIGGTGIPSSTTVRFSAFANYSFLAGTKFVPYAGAQLIIDTNGIDPDTGNKKTVAGVGVRGGIRYFVTENINIDAGPNVSVLNHQILAIFNVGLGFIFGKK